MGTNYEPLPSTREDKRMRAWWWAMGALYELREHITLPLTSAELADEFASWAAGEEMAISVATLWRRWSASRF